MYMKYYMILTCDWASSPSLARFAMKENKVPPYDLSVVRYLKNRQTVKLGTWFWNLTPSPSPKFGEGRENDSL